MHEKSKVSIIIPCYNDGKFLPEAILSVEKCEKGSYEIIIVNDGSTDKKTLQVLDLMKKKGCRVFCIKHSGPSAARNFGAKKSKHQILLFLDADDKLELGFARKAVRLLCDNKNIDLVYGDRQEFGIREKFVSQGDFDISKIILSNYISSCFLIKKKIFEKLKGFDEKLFLWEDWEFFINAYKNGCKFYHIPELSFYYRIRKNSSSKGFKSRENRTNALRYIYKKHYNIFVENFQKQIYEKGLLSKPKILKSQLEAKKAEILALESKIFGKEKELKGKDSQIAVQKMDLQNKEAELQNRTAEVNFLKDYIENLERSLTFKALNVYQKCIDIVLPKNFFLRKIYDQLIKLNQDFINRKNSPKNGRKLNRANTTKEDSLDEVDIIMPVYNGFSYLKQSVGSIIKNSDVKCNFIIIDDVSTDKKVPNFLKSLKSENGIVKIKIVKNETNLGFIKTVNKGLSISRTHSIIVNSDIIVPRNWISRMIAPLKSDSRIASITPFSNSGTICSFPEINSKNNIFPADLEKIDSFFEKIGFSYVEIPVGVGFCMLMNKNAINKIGYFDQDTFYRGYCEEVDWCLRAKKAGWKNVHIQNLFVYHFGNASFGKEAVELSNLNQKEFYKKHPDYDKILKKFLKRDPAKITRLRVINEINKEK